MLNQHQGNGEAANCQPPAQLPQGRRRWPNRIACPTSCAFPMDACAPGDCKVQVVEDKMAAERAASTRAFMRDLVHHLKEAVRILQALENPR